MSSRVLGVDACKMGWVGVVLHEGVATVHVLDAGAAAWTATRVAAAVATPLPNPPVEYSDGWPAAIWV